MRLGPLLHVSRHTSRPHWPKAVRKGNLQRTRRHAPPRTAATSAQALSHLAGTLALSIREPLNVHLRHDPCPDRLRPLLDRQAGPRRPEGGARAAGRPARAHLHRPWADRDKPGPARPRPGAGGRARRRHAGRAEARPAGALRARRAHDRRRARRPRRQAAARVPASTIPPTRWARCSSTSSPPSPSSRPT